VYGGGIVTSSIVALGVFGSTIPKQEPVVRFVPRTRYSTSP